MKKNPTVVLWGLSAALFSGLGIFVRRLSDGRLGMSFGKTKARAAPESPESWDSYAGSFSGRHYGY